MAMELRLDVFGDKQVARELLRFSERSVDMRPAWAWIHSSFLGIERRQFSTQGAFSGGWAPLAPSTVRRKARLGLDPRILHATLALRQSLTQTGHPGHVYEAKPDTLTMGTSVKSPKGFPYPAVHQNPQRGQTRRRPIELTERHKRRWVKLMQGYIVGGEEAGPAAGGLAP